MPNDLKFGEKQGTVLAPAPDQPIVSALALIDHMTPTEIFIPGTMDKILALIKTEVDRQATNLKDMTVKSNRDALRSLAMRVVKSRTFVEGQRKGLVAGRKKELADIDSEARRIGAILEGIEDDVRAPLTAWEQIDKDRKAKHEGIITELVELAQHPAPYGATSEVIADRIAEVEAIDPTQAEEFAVTTEGRKAEALKALRQALNIANEQEAQKAENGRLQAEANERAIKERERLAAEAAVEREKVESARREREAEERAQTAEKMRLAEVQASARRAEEAAAQAECDKEAAIEAERKRVAAQKEKELAEAAARERNKKHKATVHEVAIDNLLDISGMTADIAAEVVEAIAAGKIPHVSIAY